MFASKPSILCITMIYGALAAPIPREVPQEHSHEKYLTSVRASLALNNPLNLGDPVFALLGNAAAADGLGDTADPDCLQQAIADQAFTNAKEAGDLQAQVDALVFRALERNTGSVGQASAACTSITAVNPEIAALQQHQDPASDGAAALNKEITLELASQISQIGGDAAQALESGTFAPGEIGDTTGAGNTCDDADDPEGCIFTQKLLVEDASVEEIDAVVAGGAVDNAGDNTAAGDDSADSDSSVGDTADCASPVTVTVVADAAATATVDVEDAAKSDVTAADDSATDAGNGAANTEADDGVAGDSANLQTFTGELGAPAPTVTEGGRGFIVEGNDEFLNSSAALGRSCDVQKNKCANVANSGGGEFSVGDCDAQAAECRAAIVP